MSGKIATHICHDCMVEMTYLDIVEHVRSVHGREPLSGPVLAVGDLIYRQGINWRVVKIYPNGDYEIVPLISFQVEYRLGEWKAQPVTAIGE